MTWAGSRPTRSAAQAIRSRTTARACSNPATSVGTGATSTDPLEVGPFPTDCAGIEHARAVVLDRIAWAAGRVGRDPAQVTLVAVSKTVPAERVRAAVAAGLTVLGENRVQ
ncbi:MAG: hypothetical protein ACRDGQ_12905, partial [Candidatus Limnocylindrales bacterium]